MDADEATALMEGYRTSVPKFWFRVHCWHTTQSSYTDSKGNSKTRTTTVTTYDAKELIHVLSCVDLTPAFNLRLTKLTKLKLTQSFVADENFHRMKNNFYEANKHQDVHCNVTARMEIAKFKPYILSSVDSHDNVPRRLLRPATNALAPVLLFPAFPLQLWLCSITGKIKLDIRKKIETSASS